MGWCTLGEACGFSGIGTAADVMSCSVAFLTCSPINPLSSSLPSPEEEDLVVPESDLRRGISPANQTPKLENSPHLLNDRKILEVIIIQR